MCAILLPQLILLTDGLFRKISEILFLSNTMILYPICFSGRGLSFPTTAWYAVINCSFQDKNCFPNAVGMHYPHFFSGLTTQIAIISDRKLLYLLSISTILRYNYRSAQHELFCATSTVPIIFCAVSTVSAIFCLIPSVLVNSCVHQVFWYILWAIPDVPVIFCTIPIIQAIFCAISTVLLYFMCTTTDSDIDILTSILSPWELQKVFCQIYLFLFFIFYQK